jgi:hypothetical protein
MDAMLREKAGELAKEIAASISTQQELSDVMRLMTKAMIERKLDAEMDVRPGRGPTLPKGTAAPTEPWNRAVQEAVNAEQKLPRNPQPTAGNRRNGTSTKTVPGESGRLPITTPRDRNGAFEPVLETQDYASTAAVQLIPRWDELRRELLVDGQIVKRFRVPAPNQAAVLAAFEEESWPSRIFDPLPPQGDVSPKRRLHETIKALNGCRLARVIRFGGDGTGQGVLWEWVRDWR